MLSGGTDNDCADDGDSDDERPDRLRGWRGGAGDGTVARCGWWISYARTHTASSWNGWPGSRVFSSKPYLVKTWLRGWMPGQAPEAWATIVETPGPWMRGNGVEKESKRERGRESHHEARPYTHCPLFLLWPDAAESRRAHKRLVCATCLRLQVPRFLPTFDPAATNLPPPSPHPATHHPRRDGPFFFFFFFFYSRLPRHRT
jgi:hypothetical protein